MKTELAEQIIELTGSKSVIQSLPLPQDDPRQRKPDISLAISVLNWEPAVKIKYGLEKTIEYFKKMLNQDYRRKGIEFKGSSDKGSVYF